MLVCNGVVADSRVQKTARSAAEAGWDVTLLGRAPDGRPKSWRIGGPRGAEVRLLPVPTPLAHPPREARRPLFRRPLAYKPGDTATYRIQQIKAWRGELRTRRAELLAAPAPRSRAEQAERTYGMVRLALPRAVARFAHRWVSFRKRQLDDGVRARGAGTPLDRLSVAFWQRAMGDRCWRVLWPNLYDFELAYGPVVDELRPDLVHANDFRMLGVGARAKIRALAEGRRVQLVWDAHEFLPGVRPWRDDARWLPAHVAHEREYVPYADAAVTVSDSLAALLRETHGLGRDPTVVLNAPDAVTTEPGEPEQVPSLRALCGIEAGTPLVVYSGGAAPQRGLDTMVEALPELPGTHTALVVNRPSSWYVRRLRERAAWLGVGDRLHVLPYVPYDQVVRFLAEADVGAIPIHHWTNHEIALITKFFEYAHARLPLVVSDVRTMAATTRETGQGEVFRAEDTADYVRAVRAVLAEPAHYRAAYDRPGLLERWTWEAQARKLDQLYSGLLHTADRHGHGGNEHQEGDGNADLCGGAREDRAAVGRAVRGQGAPRDGRRRGRGRGGERQRRGGAVPG
ncbi:glycosyltransferase family 4 protein [Streptomyces iconiensis]|uniref:D-inositol 3-phosphate glycosyltransferase n=1 Tax=Streptomyces iconiensis TaxID=1384038 RepID=A0ABT7A8C5_9ACTN|nr:glycosyltransferase family 4 protein [Streptomyces iconiensis]MDJ1137600.1 glycosyltransferase family 4 protein [Streptomyces iconiensis]